MIRRRSRTAPVGPGEEVADDVAVAPGDPVRRLLAERLRAVEVELTAVAGTASLCSLSKSGGRVDGAKYLEGRMASLMELRRRSATTDDIRAVLGAASADWRLELDRARDRELGPDWIAYRAGGVDELEELFDRLGRTAE